MKHSVCLAFVAFLAATAVAAPVFAADPDEYCNWYARTAVRQAHMAREVRSCRHLVWERPARWQTSFGEHYRWCRSEFGSGGNDREYHARRDDLMACGAL